MKRLIILSLTLFCSNSLYAITGSGTAQDPYRITSLADFNTFAGDPNYWNDYIRLETDINLAGQAYNAAVIAPDTNSSSYGFQGTAFTGVFDGNSQTIMNLTISAGGVGNDCLGLFGCISGSQAGVKNLYIANVVITGGNDSDYIGGLCAYNNGSITGCYASTQITGGHDSDYLGGLCGYNYGTINYCFATGQIRATSDAWYQGGLCGYNYGTISNCYAACQINSAASTMHLGGLCGLNYGAISNCYATGSVSGATGLAGFCATNNSSGTIINCYSIGSVTGTMGIGGFCSGNSGSISGCFWDVNTSGMTTSNGGTGETTSQMKMQSTFTAASWDFSSSWIMRLGQYPELLPRLAGDIDLDGYVDFFDFAELADNWLTGF
jgi:hypothetical protein